MNLSIHQLVKPQRNQWPHNTITSQDPSSDYFTGNQAFNIETFSRYFISQSKQQCQISFHTLSGGLHIFFGETLQILGPFLNQVLFVVVNMQPILSIFPIFLDFDAIFKKSLLNPILLKLLSKSFTVLNLMFRYLIYFGLHAVHYIC